MEHAFFKQCNTCKGDIDFGDEYFICSVSTCQRKATNFAFCSAECWDAHVPLFRHRDAWAEQKQAPTSAPKPPPAPEKTIAIPKHNEATLPRTTGEAPRDDSLPPLELQDRAGIPQDILVVASLVQQEANVQDFTKVAQVIYNRLHEHRKLEFDSTVNYPLDRREVATSDADRAQRTPWNTYMAEGLPATAICSPGVDALRAAEHPAAGDWLYFVTIDAQGTTLFTRDYQQHLANIELAKRNGVLDSAR